MRLIGVPEYLVRNIFTFRLGAPLGWAAFIYLKDLKHVWILPPNAADVLSSCDGLQVQVRVPPRYCRYGGTSSGRPHQRAQVAAEQALQLVRLPLTTTFPYLSRHMRRSLRVFLLPSASFLLKLVLDARI